MNNIRIVEHKSFDNPPKTYFKIEESLNGGYYFEWLESYNTKESAQQAINKTVES